MIRAIKRLISILTEGRFFGEFHPRYSGLSAKDSLAARGERLAERTLRNKGYRILERGWRWHRYELDLIAEKGNVIAFVEVKTRSDNSFGSPQEAVKPMQQKRIIAAGQAYALKKKFHDHILRFDVIAILMPEGESPDVLHIENAFTM